MKSNNFDNDYSIVDFSGKFKVMINKDTTASNLASLSFSTSDMASKVTLPL